MAGDLLLGVDIGTYSSKGVLCSADGEVLATETVEHGLSLPRPGWAEQDADEIWWADFVTICRKLLSGKYSGADVGAVGVSAIGSCMLPVDKTGKPLRPGVLYGIDTRATAEIARLNERFGEEALFNLSGMALTSQAIGPKILWLKRNEPDIYARTHKILTASSYLIYRLTGEYVIDRHTGSYFNPLVDIATVEWDDRFAEPIIEIERLPKFLWSTEIAGEVSAATANETGLKAGTPVSAGAVDAAAEAISVGVESPGDMMIMYGTTMFFINVTDRPVPDPSMWATAYCFPGTYDIAAGMATSGALTRWFRDQFGQPELEAEAKGGENAYSALAHAASAVTPGSEGLICLPYFAGERTPINDPQARGVFAGLTLLHTKAHIYRSILEGTAFGVRHNLEAMRSMGAEPKRLVAVGGGAKNRLWLQIVSDVTGVAQIVPQRTIGASLGDAFLAGLASGIIEDRTALKRDWVQVDTILEPQLTLKAIYDEYFVVYRNLYEKAKGEMHSLAELGTATLFEGRIPS
jgi:xylulokinase